MSNINPLFLSYFSTAIVILIAAVVSKYYPAEKPNNWYGYRTNGSRKSQESWDYAQKYSAYQMARWGMVLLALSGIIYFGKIEGDVYMYLGIALMILILVMPIFLTERALKNKFKE